MTEVICIDNAYSTTRRLTRKKPVLKSKPEDKFAATLSLPEGEGRKGEGGLRTQGYFKKSHKNKPLISIITVVFNGEEFLEETINSAINQTYDNVEYIIIDGGSTDNTLNIIRQYEHAIDYWIHEKDEGIYDAMNKGITRATGTIIGILNSDDFYRDLNAIADIVKVFKENPRTALVLGDVDFVQSDELTRKIRLYSSSSFYLWKMHLGFMPPHPGAFIKKMAYEKVGQYKLGYKIGADFDMFVRMLLVYKLPYIKLNKTLVRMRMGGVSTSGFESYMTSTKEILRSLNENQIYSNMIMVLIRLPIKYLQKILPNLVSK